MEVCRPSTDGAGKRAFEFGEGQNDGYLPEDGIQKYFLFFESIPRNLRDDANGVQEGAQ